MRTNNVFFALSAAAIFLLNPPRIQAAYLLNGKPSTVGAYAYDVPPPEKTPFTGDVGKTLVTFDTGALMDAKSGDLGASVGFPTVGGNSYYRMLFMDLGQEVALESLTINSTLAAWWTLCGVEVAFSTDGKSFGNRVTAKAFTCDTPHAEGLAAEQRLPVNGIEARFLRFRINVEPWRHAQIGEIDIQAKTLAGQLPLKETIALDALRGVYQAQVESPAVDAFGQWTRDDWPGKIRTDAELKARLAQECDRYAKVDLDLQKQDRFGGLKTLGIHAKATGKWRTENLNGRWWFITPEGNPFLMIAVDGVDLKGDNTNSNTVEFPGRPELSRTFGTLPPKDGAFADCWFKLPKGFWGADRDGIWRFNFLFSNMIRAFGPETYVKKVDDLTNRRLVAWGFNSFGKWNWRGPIGDRPKLPYIQVAGPMPEPGVSLTCYNGDFTDPWDPNLPKAVVNTVQDFQRRFGQDPYYIGFTIGNEGWWGIEVTKAMLKSVPAGYAKKAFIARLVAAHQDIAALNRICGTTFTSFAQLAGDDLTPLADKLKGDLSAFVEESSRRYYGLWRQAVDTHDPQRIMISSSFVIWWLSSPEWVRGCIPYCDVLMLDAYPLTADGILKDYVEPFAVPADKPVMIGEYGFTTSERGFKAFGSNVASQRERGLHYQRLNETLFAHPNWIGSMWFLYYDQPSLGRNWDGSGESHNFGLVDICNLPYYDMIEVMKETNAKLFDIHAAAPVRH